MFFFSLMVVNFNQVFNIVNNTGRLNFLYLNLERKVQCYNEYFINGYIFHIEEYGEGINIYNSKVCINGSTCNGLEVNYCDKL